MNTHTLLNRLVHSSHVIQGQRVVLDKEVASLYGVSTGRLKQAVRRNLYRFPPDALIKTSSFYAFTEEGVLLLSSILKTPQAIQISIDVIRELFSYPLN